MASLAGLGPHQTWKELLRVDNDPTRNQGVTSALVRVADGQGTQSALAVSTTAAKVHGAFDTTGAITSAGNITGVTLVGSGLNVGVTGQSPSATINSSGAIVGTSLSAGTSGAITGGSVNVGAGTVTGSRFIGTADTVTNGVYTNSTLYIGTTAITLNRSSAAQTLTGTNIDGNAGTVTNGVYTTSNLNIGTTSVPLNRASAAQTLTGVSIDGNAATSSTSGIAGTWTPTVATPNTVAYTYVSQIGTFHKIGKVVHGSIAFAFRPNVAPTGTLVFSISGLPYQPNSNYGTLRISQCDFTTLPAVVRFATNTATMTFHTLISDTTALGNYPFSSTGATTALAKTIVGYFTYETNG